MAKGNRISFSNDRYTQFIVKDNAFVSGTAGNVTSAPATSLYVCPVTGTITDFFLSCTMGVDGTNPLNLTAQVTNTRTGNTLCSTVPKLDKTAGNVFATTAGGTATGITPAVFTAANTAVTAGDVLKVVWTLTRTTPGTEIADAAAHLRIAEQQDFDPTVS